jgi:hypothetical protein
MNSETSPTCSVELFTEPAQILYLACVQFQACVCTSALTQCASQNGQLVGELIKRDDVFYMDLSNSI